jgi:hypothetical protein
MFKVAAVMGHPCLKSELETLAVSLAVDPCPENIFSAENLINLGREVGEIKPINAVVLIRELENLRKNLSASPLNSQASDVDISPKFTRSSVIPATCLAPRGKTGIQDVRVVSSAASSVIPASASASLQQDGKVGIQDSVQVPSKRTRTSPGRKSSLNSDKVYQYIVEHKEARLKELESAFSEVSGRTVRRMTDTLIKEGRIERVGNPGPTSFYRVKAGTSATQPSAAETGFNTSPSVIPAQAGIQAPSSALPREAPQERSGDSPQFYAADDIPEGSPEAISLSENAPQFSYEDDDPGYSDVIAL